MQPISSFAYLRKCNTVSFVSFYKTVDLKNRSSITFPFLVDKRIKIEYRQMMKNNTSPKLLKIFCDKKKRFNGSPNDIGFQKRSQTLSKEILNPEQPFPGSFWALTA